MPYMGLDAHQSQWTFCVLDHNGKKLRTQTVHGSWKNLLDAAWEGTRRSPQIRAYYQRIRRNDP
jgi:hypothetical protein